MKTQEILVYGLARGETERYTEELLSSRCLTNEDVERVIAAASADGWHSFRIATFTPGELPNFAATVKGTK